LKGGGKKLTPEGNSPAMKKKKKLTDGNPLLHRGREKGRREFVTRAYAGLEEKGGGEVCAAFVWSQP